jgi:hypothetical protein
MKLKHGSMSKEQRSIAENAVYSTFFAQTNIDKTSAYAIMRAK